MSLLKVGLPFLFNLKHLTSLFWLFEWVDPLIDSTYHLLSNQASTVIVIFFVFPWVNTNGNVLVINVLNQDGGSTLTNGRNNIIIHYVILNGFDRPFHFSKAELRLDKVTRVGIDLSLNISLSKISCQADILVSRYTFLKVD